ncbi:MAG: helix-turn-helix domain-containing protein [Nanoarchaeota archaeon]
MDNESISDKLKRHHLKDLHEHSLINFIKTTCSDYYKIDQIYLELPTRKREIITLRHMVYFFIKRYLHEMSFASIGQLIAKQNHATVLYAVKNIVNLAEFDKTIKTDISQMDGKIKVHAESLGFRGFERLTVLVFFIKT